METKDLDVAEWNRLFALMQGYVHTHALVAGAELGLFAFLSENPGASQADIGRGLGIGEYATRVLMLAVCTTGMVERDPGTLGYRNHPIAERALVPGKPMSAVPMLRFFYQVKERCGMHLADSLRAEDNIGLDREFPGSGETMYERFEEYPETHRLLQEAIGTYSQLDPLPVAEWPELSEVRCLLDVGGGGGGNAIRLCRRFPELRVTVLDLPAVVSTGRQRVEAAGLSDRITYVPCDVFGSDWPTGHDGILMSHLTEIFSVDRARHLYETAHALLPEGRPLFVWASAANELEAGGPGSSRLSMYFLTCVGERGMTYSAKWHEEMLRRAGFGEVAYRYFVNITEHAAITARR
jgi:hypothetical protein